MTAAILCVAAIIILLGIFRPWKRRYQPGVLDTFRPPNLQPSDLPLTPDREPDEPALRKIHPDQPKPKPKPKHKAPKKKPRRKIKA